MDTGRSMPLHVNPADPSRPDFVGDVADIDLRNADDSVRRAIEMAMDRFAVLIFHGQLFTDDEQIEFSSRFGSLGISTISLHPDHRQRFDSRLTDVSNIDIDNKIVPPTDRRWNGSMANRLWHADASFKTLPASYSMLSARVVPSWGGETEFSDLRAAYDALSPRMKTKLEGLVALHSMAFSRAKLGFSDFSPNETKTHAPVPQPLVRTLPRSGRKTLYLGSHAGEIVGMTVPEGRMLLHDLTEQATQREFVYRHTWKVGDFVIWDNRCTMHRGREFDMSEVRDMRRTTVNDSVPA